MESRILGVGMTVGEPDLGCGCAWRPMSAGGRARCFAQVLLPTLRRLPPASLRSFADAPAPAAKSAAKPATAGSPAPSYAGTMAGVLLAATLKKFATVADAASAAAAYGALEALIDGAPRDALVGVGARATALGADLRKVSDHARRRGREDGEVE